MYLAQIVAMGVFATEKVIQTSGKEYKENEAARRASLTADQRSHEDMCNFNKHMNRM